MQKQVMHTRACAEKMCQSGCRVSTLGHGVTPDSSRTQKVVARARAKKPRMIVRFSWPRCHVASLVMSFAQTTVRITPAPGPVTRTGSTVANALGMLYLFQVKPTSMTRMRATLMSVCLHDAVAVARVSERARMAQVVA